MSALRDVDVVIHTHWDREWCLAHMPSVARLLLVMDEVLAQLESGRLQSFLFDGQTAAMEDLLAHAEPALAERARAQARAGRLVLGPWYVMADEFLVSGESLLRNLAFGLADAAALGPVQRLGYLPDSFGHVAQMPALLRQFDIEQAVLWRGADAQRHLFDWVAPDGSVAYTLFLSEGYYLHGLNQPHGLDGLPALLDRIAARTPTGPLLLMQGGDHLAPSPAIAERMAAFNARQSAYRLRQATLAEHVAAALAANTHGAAGSAAGAFPARESLHGELRHNRQAFVLPDVLSTRRSLKRQHQEAEDRLLGEVEPLLAQLLPAGAAPGRALADAWRLLIQQQAHDSICGCSIDAVHTEMAQRFVQLDQRLDALREAALLAGGLLTRHRHPASLEADLSTGAEVFADDQRWTLFNPLPRRRQGWFVVRLFLQGPRQTALSLRDAQGQTLPHQILTAREHAEVVSPLDEFPERFTGIFYELALLAELPGLGALALTVAAGEAPSGQAPEPAPDSPAQIENSHWQLTLEDDGCLSATDRLTGRRHAGFLGLLSELDAGDSYNFSPPPQPHSVHTSRFSLLSISQGPAVQEMRLGLTMNLPTGLREDRQGRSDGNVPFNVELRLRLFGNDPALHLKLQWHQPARDHRLRLLLPWVGTPTGADGGVDVAATAPDCTWSDTAFAYTRRPARLAQIPAERSRLEMPVVVQPSLSALSAGALAIAHRALHEHEVVQLGDRRHLGLTLVRSVGWLSRRDLLTRGVGAGPDIATPGAQCLGDDEADLQVRWLGAAEPPHFALALAEALRRPPLALRGHGHAWGPPVDIGNPTLQTSAVRRTASGQLELRLWNPSPQAQPLGLSAGPWHAVFADGRPAGSLPAEVPAHGMVTLRRGSDPEGCA